MTIQLNGKTPTKICMFQPSSLPAEYQEVEYIESSGTQYFTVGTSFKTSYKTVIDFQMTVIGWDYVPLGVLNNSGQRYGIDVRGGNFTVITGGGNWNNTISEDTNRHLFTVDKSTVTVDGTSYSSQYSSYTFNKGVGIFGYHNTASGTVGYLASAKLYKLDIYDENGTLIYDLVPCYRKQDTEIGMYDLVNDVFYTNSGTGTFTKGNDVNLVEKEIKKVTIRPNGQEKQIRPAGWKPGANTLAYRPLNSTTTVNDTSGNNNNLTKSGNVGFQVYADAGNVDCAYAPGALTYTTFPASNTILFWSFIPTTTTGTAIPVASIGGNVIQFNSSNKQIRYKYVNYSGGTGTGSWFNCDIHGKRVLMGYTRDTSVPNITFFIKGSGIDSTETYASYSIINAYTLTFSNGSYNTYLSAALAENKTRTAQEVSDYYNLTKGNYGL